MSGLKIKPVGQESVNLAIVVIRIEYTADTVPSIGAAVPPMHKAMRAVAQSALSTYALNVRPEITIFCKSGMS